MHSVGFPHSADYATAPGITNCFQAFGNSRPVQTVEGSSSTTPAEEGMEPDDLLCSRNARPQKALVGRAQWKINQLPSPREVTIKL